MILTRFIAVTLIAASTVACTSTSKIAADKGYAEVPVPGQFISEEYPRPDVWAKYPGGKESLDWYIRMNTTIPEPARKDGFEGRVLLSYEVDKEGQAGNPEVLMSPHPAITEMYREIISDMEKWEPAMLNNEPVPQRYYIISSFKAGILPESSEN
jgi:hypothetical protein